MRSWDVFVVRMIPFVLFVIFNINLNCCWRGMNEVVLGYELHGNSVIYASAMFVISLSNRKYHCVWNRAMYVFLIVVPIINFIDAVLGVFPTTESYIRSLYVLALITMAITSYLAIRHFVVIRIKKIRHGRKQDIISR